MISAEMEAPLFRFLHHKCEELGARIYAVNGMEDHIHLAVSIPVKVSVSDFAQRLKGSSSYFINHLDDSELRLYWQDGFGVLTCSKRDLPNIIRYIDGQKEHHRTGNLSPKMERDSD